MGRAYLWSTLSGAQLGRLESWGGLDSLGWNDLQSCSLTCLAVGLQLGLLA